MRSCIFDACLAAALVMLMGVRVGKKAHKKEPEVEVKKEEVKKEEMKKADEK